MKNLLLSLLLLSGFTLMAQTSATLVRLDAFGGTGDDEMYGTAVDSQGNVYNTGLFHNTVDFDPGTGVFELTSNGNDEIFIQKLTADGQFVWAKQIGGGNSDAGVYIQTDNDDNVLITGWFTGTVDFDPSAGVTELTSAGSWDIFILKLNSNGDFMWAKRLGNDNLDFASAMALDANGNIFLTGMFKDSIDFDPGTATHNLTSNGAWDIFILKLDNNGNFVWAQNLGGTSYDKARSISIDANNNLYVAGQFKETADFDFSSNVNELTAADNYDAFVLKLDNDGNFIWVKQFEGNNQEDAVTVSVDNQENVYIAGKFLDNMDADPGSQSMTLNTGSSDYNSFIIKLDTNGNFVWANMISGDLNMLFNIHVIDNLIYTGGYFTGSVQITWANGFTGFTSAGDRDAIMLVYDIDGNFYYGKKYGAAGQDNLYKIVNYDQGIYVAGSFEQTVNFDENHTNITAASNGEKDAFLLKLETEPNSITQISENPYVKIYPNPAAENFYIELQQKQKVQIKIYDTSGKILLKKNYREKKLIPIHIKTSSALIFVEVNGNDFKETFRLIHP